MIHERAGLYRLFCFFRPHELWQSLKMDRFFANLPRDMLALLAISGGILFIVFSDPPYTVCDSQKELIKKSQEKFLYKDPKSKFLKTTKYEQLRDHCRASNNPGGCYELFQQIKTMLVDLSTINQECQAAVGRISEINKALWDTLELILRLAWGEKPPEAYHAKFGWLDTADISLFCKLKSRVSTVYGEDAWVRFREKMMLELPGAKDMPRNQVWDMSIFSENCARYP